MSKKDHVVCIIDKFGISDHYKLPKPKKGKIYQVEGIEKSGNNIGYLLVEVNVIHPVLGVRICYDIHNFRPVDDTFGEWVEETVMKEVELEEILTTN